MITLTKEWLQQTIAELEEERDAVPGAVNEDAALALAAMKLALASIEAEHAGVVRALVTIKGGFIRCETYFVSDLPDGDYELYISPPAPLSMKDHQIRELVNELRDIAVEYHGTQQLRERIARTVRAAMIQGAENAGSPTTMKSAPALDSSPKIAESPTGINQGKSEPVTTANKLPFEQWLSQQTGTIDVECGCVMTEVFFHWLRVAYDAGNYPVIPDGWVLVPIEPTYQMCEAMGLQWESPRFQDRYKAMLAAVKK